MMQSIVLAKQNKANVHQLRDYVVETTNLSKSFGDSLVLDELNLRVPKNSIFAFLGPNGAGKSTTIKLLLGLISSSGGSAKVFNKDIVTDTIEIRSKTGYLPQDASFHEYMTAREVLRYAIKFFYSGPETLIENRIEEMINLVDLSGKADRAIKGFSGGEKQRLGIAQAMIHKPELLILDEPAASLDPVGRRDVLRILGRLREYTTILYSTHILEDVQKVSDRVGILNGGKLVTQGTIEEILKMKAKESFDIKVEDPENKVLNSLESIKWIETLNVDNKNGISNIHVVVSDFELAKKELLRIILLNKDVEIIEFKQQSVNLEDIFMEVVGEQ